MKLMLSPGNQSTYRRSIFAEDGKTRVHTYVFDPQTPVDVKDEDLPAFADILGNIVVIPTPQKDKEILKADREATTKLAEKLTAEPKKAKARTVEPTKKADTETKPVTSTGHRHQ